MQIFSRANAELLAFCVDYLYYAWAFWVVRNCLINPLAE
jgi:hypothetical protein